MIDSEQKKSNMHNQVLVSEKECNELDRYVEELEKKISNVKSMEGDRMSKEDAEHMNEVGRIKEINAGIKVELEKLLSGRR